MMKLPSVFVAHFHKKRKKGKKTESLLAFQPYKDGILDTRLKIGRHPKAKRYASRACLKSLDREKFSLDVFNENTTNVLIHFNFLTNKMKLAILSSLIAASAAFAPAQTSKSQTAVAAGKADLEAIAKKANPTIGYYDPLSLADKDFWGKGNEATIGFLRQSEIKHGRIAMFAFVGYIVQSNFVFPWAQTLAGAPHPSADLSPEAQWDAVPVGAKWQIFAVISMLELWDECGGGGALPHYMNGRKPGQYPAFTLFRDNVHFVLDLYDPLGFNKNMSEETKERRLVAELNNGRLAMLGIFGFLCADTIPGSVPALNDIAIPYSGDPMIPFQGQFSYFS